MCPLPRHHVRTFTYTRNVRATQVLAHQPSDPDVLCNLGFLKAQLRQADEDAEAMFRKALGIAPNHVSTMNNYALMVMSNGHLRK